ncbi:MAG TPA: hypothetical protein VL371_24020 [Gemmataceae bacterium]|jgi:hypothetical protein|nr:hypothetical protein [Gemmataceae bacterium]
MWNDLQSWWQNATPDTQTLVWNGGLAAVALIGGWIAGAVVRRVLYGWNFDGFFRLSSVPPGGEDHGLTPTRVAALLVRLTIWAAAGAWLAGRYGRPEIAETVWRVIPRAWSLTAVLAGALALGGLLARRAADCFQDSSHGVAAHRNGTGQNRNLGGAVGAGVYSLVLLLALLTLADTYDWPLTRTAAGALWQLVQRLLTAAAALLVAYLGSRWAGGLATEQRAGQYTALALVAGTTVACVVLLLSSGSGMIYALLAVPVIGAALWFGRGYLSDVMAGFKLKTNKVGQVHFDGNPWQVSGVGLLTTEVARPGEHYRVPNRLVLDAAHGGAGVGRR